MDVIAVPAFADNYLWIAHQGGNAIAIDPGDEKPVLAALSAHALRLRAILITHHHADHIGGVEALKGSTGARVYGPEDKRIASDESLVDGDRLQLTEPAVQVRVIAVPGHTSSHLAYLIDDCLFCGDTLFSLGCGRLFEGSPEQMQASLAQLAALPADTRVYCAHEYTASNLAFARWLLPNDPALSAFETQLIRLRDRDQPSIPSSIGVELALNPFLNVDRADYVAALAAHGQADTSQQRFALMRSLKDHFRPGATR